MLYSLSPSLIVYKARYTNDLRKLQNLLIPKLEEKVFTQEYTKNNIVKNGNISFAIDGPFGVFEGSHLNDWEESADFINFLNPHIEEYTKHLNILFDHVTLTNMWANKYPQNSFIQEHAHLVYKNLHSIVFYLKKPYNSGNLFIRDNNIDYEIITAEGELIIFPSNLIHYTSPNNNVENKYVIGADIHCSVDPLEYNVTEFRQLLSRNNISESELEAILDTIKSLSPYSFYKYN